VTRAAGTDAQQGPWTGADKAAIRRRLIALRTSMPDREARLHRLLAEVATWLAGRTETEIGAYWPIRGEPDLLHFLGSWVSGAAGRAVGLPVIDPDSSRLVYRGWHPGVRMQDDVFGIPTPEGTPAIEPQVLLVPCVGFGPDGIRLGYGGGFFDRTLSVAGPQPLTVGIAFAQTFVADLPREDHDVPLDVILTEDGVAWRHAS
jgi:5-formyltetrahydrofolate cyclo-ligase